jgi:hypothetical protein
MTDADHYRHYTSFLNPSLAERLDYDAAGNLRSGAFDPGELLALRRQRPDRFWFLDGWALPLDHRPDPLAEDDFPGIIHRLTGLRLLDLHHHRQRRSDSRPQGNHKEEKASTTASPVTTPAKRNCRCSPSCRRRSENRGADAGATRCRSTFSSCHPGVGQDESRLSAKRRAIKNAINSMNSAQYFESSLPSTTKKLFFQTWPGWLWGKYEHRKCTRRTVTWPTCCHSAPRSPAILKPQRRSTKAMTSNLVGIKTFRDRRRTIPATRRVARHERRGQIRDVCDLLSQTENYFAYTVIIEEGFLTASIRRRSNRTRSRSSFSRTATLTINYLDTKGLPLTPLICRRPRPSSRAWWASQSEDKQMLRQAQIAKYLNLLYEDAFQDWTRKNPNK